MLDRVIMYDVETTIYKHQMRNEEGVFNPQSKNGSPFCLVQQLVMSGFKTLGGQCCVNIGKTPLSVTQDRFDESTLIVGCNLKFDINWARRIGVDVSKLVIWDCQLAEFMLGYQKTRYPSMNFMCDKYGIDLKDDEVSQAWEAGIDTDEIPTEIVREYLYGDLDRTEAIFKEQLYAFKGMRL